MCGVAGIVNFDQEPVSPAILRRMIATIRHRGPDASGIYTAANVGLANARLSILDLPGGAQPMHNEDGSVWITFNGEIFNYLELREELSRRGHCLATRSDTEVILHLYEDEGERCVEYLNGQWAFAVWDQNRRRLLLSRDRLGVRPLFYSIQPRMLVFASEIKGLLAHPDVPRRLDPRALDEIFTVWTTLSPRTAFEGISELPPGSVATLDGKRLPVRRYWNIDYRIPSVGPRSNREYAEELLHLLKDAARLRLRSDVPVGVYLSGGLDSSLVASVVTRLSTAKVKTFSVAFDDLDYDESAYQREVVGYLDTDHEQIRCCYGDIGREFPNVIWHAEAPILRTAPAPLFALSRLVRDRGYKVVLTGEGADELFGGYDLFKEAKIRRFWAAQPESRMRPLLLKRLYTYLPGLRSQSHAYLSAFFQAGLENGSDPLFSHRPRWTLTSRIKGLFSAALKDRLAGYDSLRRLQDDLPPEYPRWDGLEQAQYLETKYLLSGYILSSQGDRMMMAHSVEGRFPFLDHRVIEFASTLRPTLKMKVLDEKYILKVAASDMIPKTVLTRSKQPYRAPEARSFFGTPNKPFLHDYVEDLLSPAQIAADDVFDPRGVRMLLEKARTGRLTSYKDNMALVGVVSTQLLLDQFINHPRG